VPDAGEPTRHEGDLNGDAVAAKTAAYGLEGQMTGARLVSTLDFAKQIAAHM
jgi:hypothetical protein